MRNTQAPTATSSIATKTGSFSCAAAAIATLLITTSCTTSQQVAYSPTAARIDVRTPAEPASTEAGWYQVSEQPPTWYPVGLSKDAETDYRHGDWVRAGENDAMWFIPFRGIENRNAQELRKEALAMATPGQKVNRALDGALETAGGLVGTAADAYSFLAGGEGPAEIIADRNQQ